MLCTNGRCGLFAVSALLHKKYGDSCADTVLETELAQRDVGWLIVTGAQTDESIRSTFHGAFAWDYGTVLVSDAHTTEDLSAYGMPPPDKVIAHTNMYRSWQAAPGRRASVTKTEDVRFADE